MILDKLVKSNYDLEAKYLEIDLDLESLPYLKDHQVQGVVVLPGAVYVEMALAAAARRGENSPTLKEIEFQNVFFLPETGSRTIQMTLSPGANGEIPVHCYSKSGDERAADDSRRLHASLKISNEPAGSNFQILEEAKLEEIQARCAEEIAGKDFYTELNASGNQYGPNFQGIERLWRRDGEALAKIQIPPAIEAELEGYHLHPVLLDACTHAFAATHTYPGRTFVLVGFDQIRIFGSPGSQGWGYAYQTTDALEKGDSSVGNVHLFDESGQVVAELLGVRLRYLEYHRQDTTLENQPKTTIAVSATFTGEPVADSLRFWEQELETPFNIEFAPYNQVFQQLLDPMSLINQNKSGLNVILLRFEDWVRDDNRLQAKLGIDEKERLFDGHARHTLPNQLEIAHLNQYETDYVYQEIFVDQCYLKHEISLNDGDCVIDIGANIGLFTLFVQQQCKNTSVYAFEPSPPAFKVLDINTSLYGSDVKVFNCGLSDEAKEASFTFYEKSSVFSSFNADVEQDEKAIRAVVQNMLKQNGPTNPGDLDKFVDELMAGRLESKSFVCQLISLSDVIRDNNIQQIDLLKIDAEKSELDILKGIEAGDWSKIKQIVIEVHDREGDVIKEVTGLLQEKGFKLAIDEETLLQDSGLYNIFAVRPSERREAAKQISSTPEKQGKIRENVQNLVVALKSAAGRSASPYLVCVCPPSPAVMADPAQMAFLEQMEALMLAELSDVGNMHLVKTTDLTTTYPVSEYYDPHGDKLGHVPYRPAFFTALGSTIVRKFHAIRRAPYKVIVLDCDQTLWQGVCGEDGPLGITIDPPRKKLQEFMVRQHKTGMLVCLCSKNSEEDVMAVFDHHPEMPLKRDHLVSWRINWKFKSENIKSLAHELQLGLDSFIFVDDNPVECAEVQASCPEVLTLQLPAEVEEIPRFLDHVWAFDHLKITAEDKQRTRLYQQNIEREHFRQEALTLDGFLAGLELNVQISEPMSQDFSRVSQLTQRTNQFNLTTIRRSEAEVKKLCQAEALECLICKVSDRFGEYGLVGVILFEANAEAIKVDTFLLSCRVLGRGVEHQMLSRLGEIATERGLRRVDMTYLPTKKNQPALDFLNNIGSTYRESFENGFLFSFPTEDVKTIVYNPGVEAAKTSDKPINNSSSGSQVSGQQLSYFQGNSERLNHIATRLYSVDQIQKIIETQPTKQRPDLQAKYVAPNNELERSIANIWQKVLGIEKIGIHDSFAEIGGTSLQGVQLIAQLQKELNVDVTIVNLFESPTINSMVKLFSQGKDEGKRLEKIRDRGQKRRAKRRSRKHR